MTESSGRGGLVWLTLCVFCLSCGEREPPPKLLTQGLLLQNVRLVEITDGSISNAKDILMDRGEILEVGPAFGIDVRRAERVIDGKQGYAIPGLIDVHAHIGDGGLHVNTEADREQALRQFIRYGVTTIFAPGGGGCNEDDLRKWQRKIEDEDLEGPGLYGSGALLTAPGSHPIGTIWDLPAGTDPQAIYKRGAIAVAENDSVGPLLDRKLELGIRIVKIVVDDGPEPWYPKPRLSNEKVKELVDMSHQRGMRVVAHVSLARHVRDAVDAGVDGIMHAPDDPIPEEVIRRMARDGVFYVATLSLFDGLFRQALGQFEESDYARAGVSQKALQSLNSEGWISGAESNPDWIVPMKKALAQNLTLALNAGVPLALGSDVNNPTVFPGYSVHKELALMVEMGLTPREALNSVTQGGAAFLGCEDRLGQIVPGFEPDILVLEANPLEDILNTRTLTIVISDGQLVSDIVSTSAISKSN